MKIIQKYTIKKQRHASLMAKHAKLVSICNNENALNYLWRGDKRKLAMFRTAGRVAMGKIQFHRIS